MRALAALCELCVALALALALALTPAATLARAGAPAPHARTATTRHAHAASRRHDIAATHAFLVANYRLARASVALIKPTERRDRALAHELGRRCKGAADGSPQNSQDHRLTYEVAGALWSITFGSAAGPIHRFDRRLTHLRWSSDKLTQAVRRYARSLRQMAAIKMPDICADVEAWRASGYSRVPQSTERFDRHVEAIELDPVPQRLLAPYLTTAAERRMIARTQRVETRLLELEIVEGQKDLLAAIEMLGLSE